MSFLIVLFCAQSQLSSTIFWKVGDLATKYYSENWLRPYFPKNYWSKIFLKILHAFLHPYTFPEKARLFLVATPCDSSKLLFFNYLEVLQGVSINNFDECVSTYVSQLHTFNEIIDRNTLQHLQ